MNISLPAELQQLVQEKINSGKYLSAAEVIYEALQLLQAHDQMQELRAEVADSMKQLGLDEFCNVEALLDELLLTASEDAPASEGEQNELSSPPLTLTVPEKAEKAAGIDTSTSGLSDLSTSGLRRNTAATDAEILALLKALQTPVDSATLSGEKLPIQRGQLLITPHNSSLVKTRKIAELPPTRRATIIFPVQRNPKMGGFKRLLDLVLVAKNSRWWLASSVLIVGLALAGGISGLLRWQKAQELKAIEAQAQAGDYAACISAAKTMTQRSSPPAEAQTLLGQCEAAIQWQKALKVQTLSGHSGPVWSVVFGPERNAASDNGGNRHNQPILVSGSSDNTLKIWHLSSSELLQTLHGHQGAVWSLAISPGGRALASGSSDNTIKTWNLSSGKLLRTRQGHLGPVLALTISPNGELLASGSGDNTIKVWKLYTEDRPLTLVGHTGAVRAVAFSPDQRTLVSGSSDNTLKVWDLGNGKLLRTLVGHSDRVLAIAISPDGKTLASGSVDKTIKLWNLSNGELLQTLGGNSDWVNAVAISPDGQTLASGVGDRIKLWNLPTGEPLNSLPKEPSSITSAVFSSDGTRLAVGTQKNGIKVFSLPDVNR